MKQNAKAIVMRYVMRCCRNALLLTAGCCAPAAGEVAESSLAEVRMDILTEGEWRRIDQATDRALEWLAARQKGNGSFPTIEHGQPGVTGLCVLAFLSKGHLPGQGEYGRVIQKGLEYVLDSQKTSGLIARIGPSGSRLPAPHTVRDHRMAQTSMYNHAIGGLVLCESYAMADASQASRMRATVMKALALTIEVQRRPKRRSIDHGGWRYLDAFGQADSDLSVIGWQLMFLRSAKNAGFPVPNSSIDDAVACIRRHFVPRIGNFVYTVRKEETPTRAMAGAGILALAHAGMHNTEEAHRAGQSMLDRPFDHYNHTIYGLERYHYSVFHCCQAAYQLGGRYWEDFFPRTAATLLANQQSDGSWPEERSAHGDDVFGNAYTTALVVLSLGAPNGILPIYQR